MRYEVRRDVPHYRNNYWILDTKTGLAVPGVFPDQGSAIAERDRLNQEEQH